MTFLCLGSDEATTFSATEKSAIQIFFQTSRLWFRLSAHHFLHRIKKFLCDNRFVLTLKNLAIVEHQTGIDRIFEKFLIIRHRKFLSAFSFQSKYIKFVTKLSQSEVSCGICLKCLFDKWSNIHINNNSSPVVYISQRRHLRPYTFLHFVSLATLDILTEVINIILGLRKSD